MVIRSMLAARLYSETGAVTGRACANTPRARVRRACTAVGFLVAGGCEAGVTDRAFNVMDSAGIAVASNTDAAWMAGQGWVIAADPDVEIGVVDGDSAYQFFGVSGAVRLSDARIAVSDQSTNRIRYYSPDGRFLHAAGGSGRGPGEFVALRQLRTVRGDTLLAWDHARARVTILDPAGAIAGIIQLTGTGYDPLGLIFRLSDGRFMAGGSWSTAQVANDAGTGLYRPGTAIFLFDPGGQLADTVTVLTGADMAVMDVDGRRIIGIPLFAHEPSTAVHNDEIYTGSGDTLEVRVFEPAGNLVRILRGPSPDLAYSANELRLQQAAQMGAGHGSRDPAYWERLFAAMPLPERKPAFVRMIVDRAGNIWLEPFTGFVRERRPWTVFRADGRLLGDVRMPDGLRVLEIGDDYVLGVWRNEVDVEFVRLHAIERP